MRFPRLLRPLLIINAIVGVTFLLSWLGPVVSGHLERIPASHTSPINFAAEFALTLGGAAALIISSALAYQRRAGAYFALRIAFGLGAVLSLDRLLQGSNFALVFIWYLGLCAIYVGRKGVRPFVEPAPGPEPLVARVPPVRAWDAPSVEANVRYLRSAGFFAHEEGTDEQIARRLLAALREKYDGDVPRGDADPDMTLLEFDHERVWSEDLEHDVLPGNRQYEETLPAWGAISRGCFQPTDITERWDDKGADIEFTFAGRRVQLRADDMGDYFDTGLFAGFNNLIASSGLRYEFLKTGDQTAFIVVLTAAEKLRLQRERGWAFATS